MSRRPRSRTHAWMGTAASVLLAGLIAIPSLAPAPAAAADFGRIFFSPAQRAAMTTLRDHPPSTSAPEPLDAAPVPQRVDGILRRPDGRNIVWLDGEPQVSPAGYRLPAGRALALIPDDSPAMRLRVGDSWPRSDKADAQWPRIAVRVTAGTSR